MELKDNKTEESKNRFSGEYVKITKEVSIIHARIFINELACTHEDKAAGCDSSLKLWDHIRQI